MSMPSCCDRLTLRFVLLKVSPLVARLISVPDDLSLEELHDVGLFCDKRLALWVAKDNALMRQDAARIAPIDTRTVNGRPANEWVCLVLRLLSTLGCNALSHSITLVGMQSPLGNDHIREHWLKALGAGDQRGLDRRLAWDDLDQERARDVFEEDHQRFCWDDASEDRTPDWAVMLATLQAAIKASASNTLVCAQDNPSHFGAEQLPFCDLWQPAVDAAVDLLRLRIDAVIGGQRAELVERHLAGALLARLCRTAERALWDLFQSDRGAGASVLAYFGSTWQNEPPRPAKPTGGSSNGTARMAWRQCCAPFPFSGACSRMS
jgi:hypothetical protein